MNTSKWLEIAAENISFAWSNTAKCYGTDYIDTFRAELCKLQSMALHLSTAARSTMANGIYTLANKSYQALQEEKREYSYTLEDAQEFFTDLVIEQGFVVREEYEPIGCDGCPEVKYYDLCDHLSPQDKIDFVYWHQTTKQPSSTYEINQTK